MHEDDHQKEDHSHEPEQCDRDPEEVEELVREDQHQQEDRSREQGAGRLAQAGVAREQDEEGGEEDALAVARILLIPSATCWPEAPGENSEKETARGSVQKRLQLV